MKTIWKFPLPHYDVQDVAMPDSAEVLSVQMQAGRLCLWAMVDPDAAKVNRRFHIVGTGEPFDPDDLIHVGTVQDEQYIWHVFEYDPLPVGWMVGD